MSDLDAVPQDGDNPPDPDRYEGLPARWSHSAKEVFLQVEQANPNLLPHAAATLWECAALIARADACADRVEEDGPMIRGSRSVVAHPLIAEERHARAAAIAGLRALGLAPGQSSASAAGAALVSKRWQARGQTPGRRNA